MLEQQRNSCHCFEQWQERRIRSFGLGLAHQPAAVLSRLRFNKRCYNQLASPEHVQSSSSPILHTTKCETPKTAQEPPLPTDESTPMETLEWSCSVPHHKKWYWPFNPFHAAKNDISIITLYLLKDDHVHHHQVTPWRFCSLFYSSFYFLHVFLFYLLKDQILIVTVHLFWRAGVMIWHLSMSVTLFHISSLCLFTWLQPFLAFPFLPSPWFVYLC